VSSIEFDNLNVSTFELQKLVDRFGETGAYQRLEQLSLQKHAKGYRYKSDYHAVLSWERREQKRTPPLPQKAPEMAPQRLRLGEDHGHICPACNIEHNWRCGGLDHDGWPCGMPVRIACGTYIAAYREQQMARRGARG